MNLKDTYNKIGDDWFKDHETDDWWHAGTDKFLSFLRPGVTVFDVGCGAGIASGYLIEKGFSVIGSDFSEKMVEIASKENPKGKFFVADINDLSSVKENFDGVYAKAVLLHIPKKDVLRVIVGLVEKLKPGGYIYVAVKGAKFGQKEEQVITETLFGHKFERFFSFFFAPEMEKYFTDVGLAICHQSVVSTGKTDWIEIIGQKAQ